ncbi:hypothetical protein MPC1_5930002 [Methylocella tundrae]|uniref:helix-turn-helix transcriptional regulator n=1 Tax=Methylocella tundrae TaxID=227605 RepID=UPI001313B2B8|nr:helix-turn-helix domain-containing protein [Methylocella tundrae]VTZ27568.1 hypothetical protein MPC1_5930002 [Methylocella tundrae]
MDRTLTENWKLLDENGVADFLNVKVATLQSWRVKGCGPDFVRVGRCIRYRPSDILAWVEARTCANTSQNRASGNSR